MIKINSLNKYYNRGRLNEIHVINNISLDLPERGMVAIFGKSGCGKTTLLNVIGGLDRYQNGSVEIENSNIGDNTDEIRNRYMGYIFQNYNLNKNETCFDNVADALRLCGMKDADEIEKRVMAALKNVGMDMYRLRTPDTLSGGQQQRIAIARAIVKNPPIILADEPTGNLDESNTIAIMELLKCIAKQHLVLLVTHEANLVDYYCDQIIELNDGQVVSVRENTAVRSYTAKDKNDIYLGEMQKSEIKGGSADVEYYGEAPAEPVKITLVNSGGKMFIRIDTPKIQVLDESSEVKLREGVYQSEKPVTESKNIDMSELTPVEGKHYGKLFSFWSAVKSGYMANFKKGKKGRKFLRACMFLFAAVIVVCCAFFGTSIGSVIDIDNSYNDNVFYVSATEDSQQKLQAALDDSNNTGIDFICLNPYSQGDRTVFFSLGSFESFNSIAYIDSNAVYLDAELCKDLSLVVGKKDNLKDNEMVITTAVGDKLIESSLFSNIKQYSDLLGLVQRDSPYDLNSAKMSIVGVVRSNETSVYINSIAMATYALNTYNYDNRLSVSHSSEIKKGSTQLFVRNYNVKEYPEENATIYIHGVPLTVEKITAIASNYSEWLYINGIDETNTQYYIRHNLADKYAGDLITQLVNDDPESGAEGSKAWEIKYAEYWDLYYKEFYDEYLSDHYFEFMDEYYSHYNEFLNDYLNFSADQYAWLSAKKNNTLAKCLRLNSYESYPYNDLREIYSDYYIHDGTAYYFALTYKQQYGKFPSYSQMHDYFYDGAYFSDETYYNYEKEMDVSFYREFENYSDEYSSFVNSNNINLAEGKNANYVLNDEDYIAISKQYGKTHASVRYNSYDWVEDDYAYYGDLVVHSNNPQKTLQFFKSAFRFSEDSEYSSSTVSIMTPKLLKASALRWQLVQIIVSVVALCVMLALMIICMYFIMRSSIMNRIKEIGIYRAIGVSKRNMIFKFFVEALVLTTLTVFIGFLFMSIIVSLIYKNVGAIFVFYPVWYALIVFVFLYAICLLCGVLPILTLLRKTPSEILSKYDI